MKTPTRRRLRRRDLIVLSSTILAMLIGVAVGAALAHRLYPQYIVQLSLAAGLIFGLIFYLVFSARVLFKLNRLRFKHLTVNTKLKSALSHAEERYQSLIDKQDSSCDPRMGLALVALLQHETESSIQHYQQAQRLGARSDEFFNNAGVALARRGNYLQAKEMFEKALQESETCVDARENLAHTLIRLGKHGTQSYLSPALDHAAVISKFGGEAWKDAALRGHALLTYGKPAEAASLFSEAESGAKSDSGLCSDIYTNLGVCQSLAGDSGAAMQSFYTAVKLDPGNARALSDIGLLQLEQGMLESGLQILERSAALDMHCGAVKNALGYALCLVHANNDGIPFFKESLMLDPELWEADYNLGRCYASEQISELADQYLDRALRINPECWQAMTALAVLRMREKDYKHAQQLLAKAGRHAPDSHVVQMNLGICFAQAKSLTEAEECFSKVIARNKTNHKAIALLGLLNLSLRHISAAEGEFTASMTLAPTVGAYHHNLALCKFETAAYDDALKYFRRALNRDPHLSKPRFHMGCVAIRQNRLEDAIKEWQAGIKLEPNFAGGYCNLGVAQYKQRDYESAIVQFRKAVGIRQNRIADYANLALALARHGAELLKLSKKPGDTRAKEAKERFTASIDMFDRAIAIDPRSAMLHSNRGLASFYAGRAELAVKDWAAVTALDPQYARKRGKAQQTEFDDSTVDYEFPEPYDRAEGVTPDLPEVLCGLLPGYDLDEWQIKVSDQALADAQHWRRDSVRLERQLQAIHH